MASNIIYEPGWKIAVACSDPTTPTTGSPVRFGERTGIALTDEGEGGNAATETTVNFGPFVADLSVKAVDDDGNSAVAVGDMIFYVDADTPKLSKKASGYFFGFAQEAITSGSTDTINVSHADSGGWVGSVATGDIASGAVTAAKLSTTLKTGTIQLDITSLREIASNDIQALAAHGGLLASDSDPSLARVNGATDKALRVIWDTANDTDEVQFAPVAKPADLDASSDLTIHLWAAMAGATDTPTIDVQVYDGTGDTEMGGATGAITGTTPAEYTVTIANANVAAAPGMLNIALVPGAHTNDALYLYAAWIEYTRA